MGVFEVIYDHSPIFLQNIMCSVSGGIKYYHRYKGDYKAQREFCRKFDAMSLDEQLQYQKSEMIRLIKYAATNSEFYGELYKEIDLESISTIEDLKKLPIVDKEMLRSNIERVHTVPSKGSGYSNTGGTTGKSLTVRETRHDNQVRMAVLDHFKARVGFDNLKMKRATFNGKHIIPPTQTKPVYWRYNAPCKQMIYSSFHLTEDKIGYYIKSLNKFKPQAIDGFFTSICDIASYIERHKIVLSFTPVAIFPTSETITNVGRALIERVFKCKVYDQYASSEGAPFVTECKNQRLHIELNTGVFEVMDDGDILVTSFSTYATPLIRYAIGDKMEMEPSGIQCDCGLHGPIVKRIQGRRLDFIYSPDGAKINAGNVSNLLKYLPNSVIRSQFRQEKKDELVILLEVDEKNFREKAINEIIKECKHTFGSKMKVDVRIVEYIPREKSGKYRLIVNNVVE